MMRWLLTWIHDRLDRRTCRHCGRRGYKDDMVHDRAYGWYCTDAELAEYWLQDQL